MLLRQQPESVAMPRPNCCEVANVQGDNHIGFQSLSERNDRCISASERKVGVLLHQIADTQPVIGGRRFHVEVTKTRQECPSARSPKRLPTT